MFGVKADVPFQLLTKTNQDNRSFIAIQNLTNKTAYCTISGEKYFVDFYVYPKDKSRWYPEPYISYHWLCR